MNNSVKINMNEVTVAAAQKLTRTTLLQVCWDAIVAHFGEDAATQISDSEFVVAIGTYGESELCGSIKFSGKEPIDRKTEKKTYTAYNRIAEGQKYQDKLNARVEAAERKKSN